MTHARLLLLIASAATCLGTEVNDGSATVSPPPADRTCSGPVQSDLLYNISSRLTAAGVPGTYTGDESLAEVVCCDKRAIHLAEPRFSFEAPDIQLFSHLDSSGVTTFYDSVCGIPLFRAPMGRTFADFQADTTEHGWPSFRPAELVQGNVLTDKTTGFVTSKCGTHLGSFLPDARGARWCLDLSCLAGKPQEQAVVEEAASPVLRGASDSECKPVATQSPFDLTSFVSKRWYGQQQMATKYLPKEENYCVYAEYEVLKKKSFWGYSIQVHNYAEEQDRTQHDSKKKICAYVDPAFKTDAKLQVGPCFLPKIKGFSNGPYWIVNYDEALGYALIAGGQPTIQTANGCKTGSGTNDSGLWIFTRARRRDDALVQKVRAMAAAQGFDLSVLRDIDQTNCD